MSSACVGIRLPRVWGRCGSTHHWQGAKRVRAAIPAAHSSRLQIAEDISYALALSLHALSFHAERQARLGRRITGQEFHKTLPAEPWSLAPANRICIPSAWLSSSVLLILALQRLRAWANIDRPAVKSPEPSVKILNAQSNDQQKLAVRSMLQSKDLTRRVKTLESDLAGNVLSLGQLKSRCDALEGATKDITSLMLAMQSVATRQATVLQQIVRRLERRSHDPRSQDSIPLAANVPALMVEDITTHSKEASASLHGSEDPECDAWGRRRHTTRN